MPSPRFSLPPKTYFEDLMYGRKRSLFWEGVISALSIPYGAAVAARHGLYRFGVFKQKKLPCPVVAVGNVTLGGTGKTPAVIHLAELLVLRGRRPVVISRGYGRKNEEEILTVSDGTSVVTDAATCGDEPVLIASKLPGVPVVVGRDRYAAGRMALERFNPDVVLLDDGFQHIRLNRTLDIVLVDARDPFGNGKLFPAGILREPLSALKRSQAVLITNAEGPEKVVGLKETIRRHTDAAVFMSRQIPRDLVDCRTGESQPLSTLKNARVLALSGIARPASFLSLLRELGADIAAERSYPDHYQFNQDDLSSITRAAADSGAAFIVTTEKDAVRFREPRPDGIWALRIELSVNETGGWQNVIERAL